MVLMDSMDNITVWPAADIFPSPPSLAPPSVPSPLLRKYPKACIVCRNRKVKCDRQLPCSTCRRWGIQDCVYPSPIRVSPRPRRNEAARNDHERPDRLLLDRLRKLEIMVQKLGGNIDADGSSANSGTPAEARAGGSGLRSPEDSTNDGTSSEKGVGRLVTKNNRSRYLSPAFWVGVDEVWCLSLLLDYLPNSTRLTTLILLSTQRVQIHLKIHILKSQRMSQTDFPSIPIILIFAGYSLQLLKSSFIGKHTVRELILWSKSYTSLPLRKSFCETKKPLVP